MRKASKVQGWETESGQNFLQGWWSSVQIGVSQSVRN